MGLSNFLTFFLGLAGLGSEVLYLKLLDYTIGSTPIISFVIVAFFILGQALGSFTSLKYKKIYLIEILLGIYNLSWFFFHGAIEKLSAGSMSFLSPYIGTNFSAFILASILLALPSIALGFSFPSLVEINKGAAKAQMVNALGAFSGLLIMEFILYPGVGVFNSLLLLGVIHLGNAWGLSRYKFLIKSELFKLRLYPILIGSLTGAIQACFLMLIPWIFQPFHYISTLVIMSFILGLSLGAIWYKKEKFQIENSITNTAIGLLLSLTTISFLLKLPVQQFSFVLSSVIIILTILLVSVPIGTIYPALMRNHHFRVTASQMNVSLSLGNFIGIIFAFILSATTPIFDLLFSIVVLFFVMNIAFFFSHVKYKKLEAIISGVLFVFCVISLSEEKLIKVSSSWNDVFKIEHVFRSQGELGAIYSSSYHGYNEIGDEGLITERRLYQNGFSPIDLNLKWESVISAVGRGYSENFNNVLILGIGSGRSAGTASLYFSHTDVVDVSPNVKKISDYLSKENYNLNTNKNVSYYNFDAILAPHLLKNKYDLIILTVDPGYHLQATKLYTTEYFKSLSSLLNESGVLIFWLDKTLVPEATQVIINSAKDNFIHQKLFSILKSKEEEHTYFLVVTSQKELNYRYLSSSLDERLDNFLKENREFTHDFYPTKKTNSIYLPNWSLMTSGFTKGGE